MIYWVKKERRPALQKDPHMYIQMLLNRNVALSSEDLYELAVCFDLLHEFKETKRYCQIALQKNLAHTPSLYGMSLRAFEDKSFDEAKRSFGRAIRLDPDAAGSALHFQVRLRTALSLPQATQWGLWCLEQVQLSNKASDSTQFELAKILFERSEFERAIPLFKSLVRQEDLAFEVTQYLSYIYERLYTGDELVERTLELAQVVPQRSDLFFNLGMVCQHEQKRLDLSIHFFYLAVRSDAQDPSLRFSLEQACLELIGAQSKPSKPEDYFQLMLAHLYHGSVAVAERYARILRERYSYRYPLSFESLAPKALWSNWLLKDEGLLSEALRQWFGDHPVENWKITKRND